jgi:hypothetical protein
MNLENIKKVLKSQTLISVLCTIILIIGIPYGIYGLMLEGGGMLGGMLIFLIDIGVFFILIIDRKLVKKIDSVTLSLYELIIVGFCLTMFFYFQRKLILEVQNNKVEYLIVIQNNGMLKNNLYEYAFPFDKRIISKTGIVVVDHIPNDITFNLKSDWKSHFFYNSYQFRKYPLIKLYCKPNCKIIDTLNEALIDSLIQAHQQNCNKRM